ncbi:hypothetical protein H5J25_13855 [Sphingomonas aliaeris]|uniref:Uncharacterized protein n=1 Tax=Sphingomonas aliaeris TaxID=2759526 RepID=A0A974S3H3_9SPHN|nr:hypothetical protein [Sphingomonas aliaeris]QQV76528.1 hypothetical protein H5J25_13855 [Sphingomonas aliaeris]
MSSANPPIAARDFTDAGTERFFAADAPIDADDGTIANYRAAGLIKEDEAPSSKKPTDKPQGDKPA